jgi:hypothetical protein
MAVISAPIPGCAGGAAGVELGVLAAAAAGVAVARLAVAAAGAVRLAAFTGGVHATKPASGFTVGVVLAGAGAGGVPAATASPEFTTGSRPVTRAAKGFTALVVCPEVVFPVCAPKLCAGTRVAGVRVIEC